MRAIRNWFSGSARTGADNVEREARHAAQADQDVDTALHETNSLTSRRSGVPQDDKGTYVPPLSVAKSWRVGAARFAATAALTTVLAGAMVATDVSTDVVVAVTVPLTMWLVGNEMGKIGTSNLHQLVRIGFIRLAAFGAGSIAFKFGVEQAALAVDETLTWDAHALAAHNNITGSNCTSVNDPCIWHESTGPTYSLALLGIPCSIMFLNVLSHRRGGTSVFSAAAARIEFRAQPNSEHGKTKKPIRRNRALAAAIRYVAPFTVFAGYWGGMAGLAALGYRQVMLRMLSGSIGVLLQDHLRDPMTVVTDGVVKTSAVTVQEPDTGTRRPIRVQVPKLLLKTLGKVCGGKQTARYRRAKAELKRRYQALFYRSRTLSMFLGYGMSSVGLLGAMRLLHSPPTEFVFARSLKESLIKGGAIGWAATTMNEAWEEPSATIALRFVSSLMHLPYLINPGTKTSDLGAKLAGNAAQMSFVPQSLPFLPMIKWAPGCYVLSTVARDDDRDGTRTRFKVTVSGDDKIEMHTGIRALQNLTTTILFAAGGAVGKDNPLGMTLLGTAVVVNAATHWRGIIVLQNLIPGRELELLFHAWSQFELELEHDDGEDAEAPYHLWHEQAYTHPPGGNSQLIKSKSEDASADGNDPGNVVTKQRGETETAAQPAPRNQPQQVRVVDDPESSDSDDSHEVG